MKTVSLCPDITIKKQIDFMDNNENFVSNAVYGYLFENLTLREIESKYLGVDTQGRYAKTVLNCVGLDTSSKEPNNNKGIYNPSDLDKVILLLLSDPEPLKNNIGRLLQKVRSNQFEGCRPRNADGIPSEQRIPHLFWAAQ